MIRKIADFMEEELKNIETVFEQFGMNKARRKDFDENGLRTELWNPSEK